MTNRTHYIILISLLVAALLGLGSALPPAAQAQTGVTERVSVASDGTEGNDSSHYPSISADGRYVAFWSDASNLVAGDTNNERDVFVHDRQTGITERVSVASDGTQGNGASLDMVISADGRYVAFDSGASNLVVGDTNNAGGIFIHDRQTGMTERVVKPDDNAGCYLSLSDFSADGRYLAFESDCSKLVAGDTNNANDIFVHDRQTGITERVSVASDGTQSNDFSGGSWETTISADGRYVAFSSYADNLILGDTNNTPDAFVHDRQTGVTEIISVASDGTQGNNFSFDPAISADGRYVAFSSWADNLISGHTNNSGHVFVHDRQTGVTEIISVASDGTQGDSSSYESTISADGRYVAFESDASNLVAGYTNNGTDIFVHDRQTGITELVSVASDGTQGRHDWSGHHDFSTDGRYVAFESDSRNLVSGDTNGWVDIFVHDRAGNVDTTAPSAITDLNATTGSTPGTIDLTWTAPGDDGSSGTATAYTARYAASSIASETDWAAATDITGEPAPQTAGSSETMTISGLTPGQTYYFMVRAADEAGNTSGLGNSPNAMAKINYTASGRVTDSSGSGLASVNVSDGAGHSAITDSSGNYTISGLTAGSYILTPSRSGYTFSPTSQTVPVPPDASGVDFVGTVVDTTLPAAITNLNAATGSAAGTVHLTWTAPGDDGSSGTATYYRVRYADNEINTGLGWAAATDATGVPTPQAAGSIETMTVSGLTPGQPYYFMVRAYDEADNRSDLGNSPGAAAGGSTDSIPPGAVTDLNSEPGSDAEQILLTWTAPGDDGSGGGPAAHYDVRYSNTPINQTNWAGATQVNGEPVPGSPGITQQMTISGVATGTRWYVALRSADEASNWSPLSNIPSLQEIGFRVDRDGYEFPNWGGTLQENRNDFQIADLTRMFGEAAVCQSGRLPCEVRATAQAWYDNVIRAMSGGHCDGFTTTGLRFFKGVDTLSDFQNGATKIHDLEWETVRVRRHIANYWALQVPNPVAAARGQTLQNTPNQILDQLRDAMTHPVITPTTLIVYNSDRSSGHSITPYALQERSDKEWWVWVYDSNHADDANRYVQIDAGNNTWRYNLGSGLGTWSGDANSHSLGVIPISIYAQTPVCPWCQGIGGSSTLQTGETTTWLSGSGHLLINDSQGRRIGYVGNQFVNEVPSAFGTALPGGLGFPVEPVYHLPLSDTYTILLDGQTITQTNVVSVTQFGPGYAASVDDIMLGSTAQDQLIITPDGKQVTYQSNNNQEATLALALDETNVSYKFQIANADITAGQSVAIKADPASQQVVFDNANAGGGIYDLEVECVGNTDTQVFAHTGVNIRATDTHYASYNASNCADSITLTIDIGSQGTAYETITLENQAAENNNDVYLPIIIK